MSAIELPVDYRSISSAKRKAVREEYVARQGGLCAYCKGSLAKKPPDHVASKWINWSLFPPNFLRYPVHLQHSHETGMTEGAVHAYCNAVLWQYHHR
jgi:hypothetical protein